MDKERLHTPTIIDIPFGVDVPSLDVITSKQARCELGLPQDAFVVLYLGRLSETYKADLDILLRVVSSLGSSGPPVHLVLAGQVEELTSVRSLKSRASTLGIGARVTIVENFPDFTKPTIISCCDVVALPSDSIQETFGLAVLEGMAYGKPIVASRWSGYRDLVQHGETGFLVNTAITQERLQSASLVWPVTDSRKLARYLATGTIIDEDELSSYLELLRSNPALSRRLGLNGKRRIDEVFAWPAVLDRFFELWNTQIAKGLSLPKSDKHHPVDYGGFFSHYSDDVIDSTSIVRHREGAGTSGLLLDSLLPSQRLLLRRIQEIDESSSTIGALTRAGTSLQDVLELLKKGLCKVANKG